jgi:hypothetical protein
MKLFLILLLACAPAWAATHYVCDCSTGSDPSCSAGADGNSGTTSGSPWQTLAKVQTGVINTSPGPGDQVLFCNGGTWPASSTLSWNSATSTTTKTSPIVFDGYTASWGSVVRPILRFSGSGFFLGSNNVQVGITIQNLDIRGPGNVTNVQGIWHYNNISYVVLDNINVEGFHDNIDATHDTGFGSTSSNFILKNSTVKAGRNQGIFINHQHVLVENNVFSDNGNCLGGSDDGSTPPVCYVANQRHSVYVGGQGDGSTGDIVIRNNTSTRVSYFTGACESTHFTGHGIVTGLIVENNLVYETAATGGCYGIGYGDNYGQPNEGCSFCTWRGNTVVDVGNYYIAYNGVNHSTIENNVVVNTGVSNGGNSIGFCVGTKNNVGTLNVTNNTLRNNSGFYANGTSGNFINFGPCGSPQGDSVGTGNVVANNLLYKTTGSTATCWTINASTSANFTAWDYNLCYQGSGGINTPYTGAQAHGITSDPLLRNTPSVDNGYDMQITSGSPAKDAATATYASRLAIHGYPKNGARDIGAYEYGSNPVAYTLRTLDPRTVDASATANILDLNYILPVPAGVTAVNKLFVFLPGTSGYPYMYQLILKAAAKRGWHAIGLDYVNPTPIGVICQTSVDQDCYWNVRREVITATNYSADITIAGPDAIFTRLQETLTYLNSNYPGEGWGQYVSGGVPVWSKIVVGGHSQGGGHVGVMAKLYAMAGACYFASPPDWNNIGSNLLPANSVATWEAYTNVTPVANQYAIAGVSDASVPYAHMTSIIPNIGLTGSATSVDGASPPYGSSHFLTSDATPKTPPNTGGQPTHGLTIRDVFTPTDGNGRPVFDPAWGYMCFQ